MIDLDKVRLLTPEQTAAKAFEMIESGAKEDIHARTGGAICALCRLSARRKILLHRTLAWMYAAKLLGTELQPDLVAAIEDELNPVRT